MNIISTFVSGPAVLDVLARSSRKKGISVFVRMKAQKGAKYQLGMRTMFPFEQEKEARARYEELVASAKAGGWGEPAKTKIGGSVGKFDAMPAPPVEPEGKPKGKK